MNRDKLSKPEEIIEGDVNFSDARRQWEASIRDERTKTLLEKDARYFMHQALSTPCLDVLENCSGAYIESSSGGKYLDFHGNNVHQIGFSHPKLIEALEDQLRSLTFSTRRYTNEIAIRFAEKLVMLAPGNLQKVLLTPNGSSAVGIALKIARAVTGKEKVLSFWDSFHGASLDVIGVSGASVFQTCMGNVSGNAVRIPPPGTYRGLFEGNEDKCLEHLDYVLTKDNRIGAFLAEPIRNTDVQVPSAHFWKEARRLCSKHQVLLILDEISIALGRTGKMFAFEHFGIEPDILCLGKGLGGGIIPQAAVVLRKEYDRFSDISLGHYTHEKSPLGARAGLTTIQILEEENLLNKVKEDEIFMRSALENLKEKHMLIGDIRGMGLLWGVELVSDRRSKVKAIDEAERIMYACLKEGLNFKVAAGNVLQLSPALTIERADLQECINILHNALLIVKP